jgi:hypothetical protein
MRSWVGPSNEKPGWLSGYVATVHLNEVKPRTEVLVVSEIF